MIFRGLSTRPGRTRAQLPHPWRAVGSTVGRRVGNPVGHGGERRGEESGEPRGARWGARWGGEWETPWGTVGSAVGRIVERVMGRAQCGWGFCTIRRIAAACRRRVASLLTQFPPRDREGSGKPRGARWGGERETPWGTVGSAVGSPRRGGLWSGPWSAPGADGGFAPLDASLRRVAGVSRPYWCNSPPRGVEESGKPRGARWGAPWERERETPWSPVPNTRAARQGGQIMPSRTAKRGRAHAHPRPQPGSQSGQSSFFRSSQRRS